MPLKNPGTNTRESPVRAQSLAGLALETEYKSEKGYPMDNSRSSGPQVKRSSGPRA